GVFDAAFDEQDRLLEHGEDAFTWTDNGELYSRTDTASGDTTTYAYDAVGNLRGVGLPNGDLVEYLVDGRGRRVGKRVNGVLDRGWLWRGQLQPVAELDGAGNVVARFVYAGGVNVPALMVTPTATYRLVTDHLGSVRQVVDVAAGTVVQELDYDAWGRVLVDTNPGLQPFGFAGGLYDPDTGLVRFGARDYDAETGRWTAKDPIRFGGGVNLYAYARSTPNMRVDPAGLSPGDEYSSRLEAGIDALEDIRSGTLDGNGSPVIPEIEYAGLIYELPNGNFSYAPPMPGDSFYSDPWDTFSLCPSGARFAGDYHSHPLDPPSSITEEFSGPDLRTSARDSRNNGDAGWLSLMLGSDGTVGAHFPYYDVTYYWRPWSW
ncbi:MAG: DUF4329 domain-containing protein, partial [Gemmatimonadaceae bacterium]|nr:DUF4329 domain-containing protein [Gemmatimonadaceae bacterium]